MCRRPRIGSVLCCCVSVCRLALDWVVSRSDTKSDHMDSKRNYHQYVLRLCLLIVGLTSTAVYIGIQSNRSRPDVDDSDSVINSDMLETIDTKENRAEFTPRQAVTALSNAGAKIEGDAEDVVAVSFGQMIYEEGDPVTWTFTAESSTTSAIVFQTPREQIWEFVSQLFRPPSVRREGTTVVLPTINSEFACYCDEFHDGLIRKLAVFPHLRRLSLDCCAITDETMTQVRQLTQLQEVSICMTAVSDEGMLRLSGMPILLQIRLTRSSVTDAGIERFRSENPDVEVRVVGELDLQVFIDGEPM